MGGIGLRPWEVDRLSNEEIVTYVRGFLRFRKENMMVAFEANRLSGFLALAPYLPKHYKKPSQVVKFDWDESGDGFTNKTGYSDHIAQSILDMDKHDLEKGLLLPGSKGYQDAVDRLTKAGLWQQ